MEFLSDDILLESPLAKRLYEEVAKDLPIIDYHCHIIPQEILEDRTFEDITQLWLKGDHYKWRLMRSCGVEEQFITGDAAPQEKFRAFARILPLCIGNPIYIWCHLELKRYFGYDGEINGDTADLIYSLTKKQLASPEFSARGIIKRSNVEVICTTDDPIDDLSAHKALSADKSFMTKVLPTFRPDKALGSENKDYAAYIKQLSGVSGVKIDNLPALKQALAVRLDHFCAHGCKVSDHALVNYTYADCTDEEADRIFKAALDGQIPDALAAEKLRTNLLIFLAAQYNKRGIAMQLHLCCLRNNNTAMFKLLGADTGFDSINASKDIWKLAKFLDTLSDGGNLPKTVVYSLDPADNSAINTIINCFQGGGIRGKMQHGSAWWFNDTEDGIKNQIKTLAEYGVLGNFIGMLTDSRSFTSYVRHDYFRRIVCSFVAGQVQKGCYPDGEGLKALIRGICCQNVREYLGL